MRSFILAFILLMPAAAAAQQVSGPSVPVTVTVTDSSGAPIPNADVQVRIHSQISGSLADASGMVQLKLTRESYGLTAEADGFGHASQSIDLASADGRAIAAKGIHLILPRYTAADGPPPAPMFTRYFQPTPTLAPAPSATPGENPGTLTVSSAETHHGEIFRLHQLAAYKHVTVTVHNAHTNADETYSGVPIDLLLLAAHAPLGDQLHGKAITTGVIARGSDGYEVLLSLAEVDPAFHGGDVIVADALDGKPIEKNGPFQLVVSEDKRPARWVRNLVSISLVDVY
jgi:carboxypeptidase family protein